MNCDVSYQIQAFSYPIIQLNLYQYFEHNALLGIGLILCGSVLEQSCYSPTVCFSGSFLFQHPAVSVAAQPPHPSHGCPALSVQATALCSALTHPLLLFNYPQLSFLNSLLFNWAKLLFHSIHRHVRTAILPSTVICCCMSTLLILLLFHVTGLRYLG